MASAKRKTGLKGLFLMLSAVIISSSVFTGCQGNLFSGKAVPSKPTSAQAEGGSETVSEKTETPPKTSETESESSKQETVSSEEPKPHIKVEKITLSKYKVSVDIGESDMPIVTMSPKNATNKKEIWTSSNEKIATVSSIGRIKGIKAGECTVTVKSADNKKVTAKVEVTVTKPKKVKLKYIDGILIANKTYPLPKSYNPGVDAEAKKAFNQMAAAAKKDGIKLFIRSGFRSYSVQKSLYNGYVSRDGKAAADRYSARAGHSEHQTGLAFDINSSNSSFEGTKEAKWLAKNSYKYGFILRYPKGKESVTGYIFEPWHFRYIGKEKAKLVYESGLCLEEYLGITSRYKNA